MVLSINGKVWHTKYSFVKTGTFCTLFYADDLVMACNGMWY